MSGASVSSSTAAAAAAAATAAETRALQAAAECATIPEADDTVYSTLPAAVVGVLHRKGFEIVRELGHGSFGVAVLVKYDLGDGGGATPLVCKVIDISGLKERERLAALREVDVLRQLSHPNIIGYYGSFVVEPHLYIVLEFADGGDLAAAIARASHRGRAFSEERVMYWFCQIASALRYVHSKRILHRDLKASNIFLHTRDRIVKLGDFGIARVLGSDHSLANTVIGTPFNMSPELINSEAYSYQSDVWALGCVIYELATLRHAFDATNMYALVLRILRGTYPPIDEHRYSPALRDCVKWMLAQDPGARPTVNDIIASPLVQAALRASLARENKLGVRSLEEAQVATHGASSASLAPSAAAAAAAAAAGPPQNAPALRAAMSADAAIGGSSAATAGAAATATATAAAGVTEDGEGGYGEPGEEDAAALLASPGRRRFSDPHMPVSAATLAVSDAAAAAAPGVAGGSLGDTFTAGATASSVDGGGRASGGGGAVHGGRGGGGGVSGSESDGGYGSEVRPAAVRRVSATAGPAIGGPYDAGRDRRQRSPAGDPRDGLAAVMGLGADGHAGVGRESAASSSMPSTFPPSARSMTPSSEAESAPRGSRASRGTERRSRGDGAGSVPPRTSPGDSDLDSTTGRERAGMAAVVATAQARYGAGGIGSDDGSGGGGDDDDDVDDDEEFVRGDMTGLSGLTGISGVSGESDMSLSLRSAGHYARLADYQVRANAARADGARRREGRAARARARAAAAAAAGTAAGSSEEMGSTALFLNATSATYGGGGGGGGGGGLSPPPTVDSEHEYSYEVREAGRRARAESGIAAMQRMAVIYEAQSRQVSSGGDGGSAPVASAGGVIGGGLGDGITPASSAGGSAMGEVATAVAGGGGILAVASPASTVHSSGGDGRGSGVPGDTVSSDEVRLASYVLPPPPPSSAPVAVPRRRVQVLPRGRSGVGAGVGAPGAGASMSSGGSGAGTTPPSSGPTTPTAAMSAAVLDDSSGSGAVPAALAVGRTGRRPSYVAVPLEVGVPAGTAAGVSAGSTGSGGSGGAVSVVVGGTRPGGAGARATSRGRVTVRMRSWSTDSDASQLRSPGRSPVWSPGASMASATGAPPRGSRLARATTDAYQPNVSQALLDGVNDLKAAVAAAFASAEPEHGGASADAVGVAVDGSEGVDEGAGVPPISPPRAAVLSGTSTWASGSGDRGAGAAADSTEEPALQLRGRHEGHGHSYSTPDTRSAFLAAFGKLQTLVNEHGGSNGLLGGGVVSRRPSTVAVAPVAAGVPSDGPSLVPSAAAGVTTLPPPPLSPPPTTASTTAASDADLLDRARAVREHVDAAATHLSMAVNFRDMLVGAGAGAGDAAAGGGGGGGGGGGEGGALRKPSRARLVFMHESEESPNEAAMSRMSRISERSSDDGDRERAAVIAEYLAVYGGGALGSATSGVPPPPANGGGARLPADVVIAVARPVLGGGGEEEAASSAPLSAARSDSAGDGGAGAGTPGIGSNGGGGTHMEVATPALHSPDARVYASAVLARGTRISGRIDVPLATLLAQAGMDGGGGGVATRTLRANSTESAGGGSRSGSSRSVFASPRPPLMAIPSVGSEDTAWGPGSGESPATAAPPSAAAVQPPTSTSSRHPSQRLRRLDSTELAALGGSTAAPLDGAPPPLTSEALESLAAGLSSPALRALTRLSSLGASAAARMAPAPMQVRDTVVSSPTLRSPTVAPPPSTAAATATVLPTRPPPPPPVPVPAPLSQVTRPPTSSTLPPTPVGVHPPPLHVDARREELTAMFALASPYQLLPIPASVGRRLTRMHSDGFVPPPAPPPAPTATGTAVGRTSPSGPASGGTPALERREPGGTPNRPWRRASRRHSTGSSAHLLLANAPEGRVRASGGGVDASPLCGPAGDGGGGGGGGSSSGLGTPDTSYDAAPLSAAADALSAMEHLAYKIDTLRGHVERSIGREAFASLYTELQRDDVVDVLEASGSSEGGADPAVVASRRGSLAGGEGGGGGGSGGVTPSPTPQPARLLPLAVLHSSAAAALAAGAARSSTVAAAGATLTAMGSPTPAGAGGAAAVPLGPTALRALFSRVGAENVARVQLLLGFEGQLGNLHAQVISATAAAAAAAASAAAASSTGSAGGGGGGGRPARLSGTRAAEV